MPINPFTLNRIEPQIIKHIETKLVDRVVHDVKAIEIKKEQDQKNFDFNKQQKSLEEFVKYLAKYNIKVEGKIEKNKVKLKILSSTGDVLIEEDAYSIDSLFRYIQDSTGSLIDLRR